MFVAIGHLLHSKLTLAQRTLVAFVDPGLDAFGMVVVACVARQLYDAVFFRPECAKADSALSMLFVDAWIKLHGNVLELVDLLLSCEVGKTAILHEEADEATKLKQAPQMENEDVECHQYRSPNQ